MSYLRSKQSKYIFGYFPKFTVIVYFLFRQSNKNRSSLVSFCRARIFKIYKIFQLSLSTYEVLCFNFSHRVLWFLNIILYLLQRPSLYDVLAGHGKGEATYVLVQSDCINPNTYQKNLFICGDLVIGSPEIEKS